MFFEYGIPSALIEIFQFIAFELIAFLTVYLNRSEDFESQTVIMNMLGLIFMIP